MNNEIIVSIIINIILTAGAYLCVPVIIGFIGKKYTAKQIKRIIIINGAVIWLIFAIIRVENNIQGSGASVFLWSAIAHWILKANCLKSESENAEIATNVKIAGERDIKKSKPWILRPIAWISTIIMLMLMEYAAGFIFDIVELLLTKLENLSTVIVVLLVFAFGSTFLGLLTYSVFIIPGLIVTLSDKIYPSNHAFRYYFVAIYEIISCVPWLLAGISGAVKGGSMILYYAEIIWLIIASISLMLMGRSEANNRHE